MMSKQSRHAVTCAACRDSSAVRAILPRQAHEVRTVHALVVVAAEGLAVDEGERGDDEDDAGRCRSDARGQPSTAFVAAERVGGTVARAGVDITRLREKKLSESSAFVAT